MASPFDIGFTSGTQQFSQGLSNLGTKLSQQQQKKQETEDTLKNAIKLARAKAKIDAELNPFAQISKRLGFISDLSGAGIPANTFGLSEGNVNDFILGKGEFGQQPLPGERPQGARPPQAGGLSPLDSQVKNILGDERFNLAKGVGQQIRPIVTPDTPQGQPVQPVVTPGTQAQAVPLARGIGGGGAFATEAKAVTDPFTGQRTFAPEKVKLTAGLTKEKLIGKAIDISGKQFEAALKAGSNFARVKTGISGLVAKGKQAVNEIGGFGAKQVIGGKFKQLVAKSGLVEGIPLAEQQSGLDVYDSQLVEVVLSLSPILTGQNRVIRGIVNMLKKTVPSFPTSEASFTGQMKQTAENAFKLSMALSQGIISIEDLQNVVELGPKEAVNTFENIIRNVGFDAEAQKIFDREWQGIKATPASQPEALFAPGEATFGRGQQFKQPQAVGTGNIKSIKQISR